MPNISGQVAELQVKALIDQITIPNIYEFSIAEYRRGWFSSEVDFRVEVPWLNALSEKDLSAFTTNDFTLHVKHGPLAFIDGSVVFAAAAQEMDFRPDWSRMKKVSAAIGDQPLVHSTLITRFNGDLSGTSRLPEIDYTDPDKDLSIKMSGYSETFTLARATGIYAGSAVLPQLSISSSDFNFDMVDIEIDAEGSGERYNAKIVMPKISMRGGEVNLDIVDIKMDMTGSKIADYLWGGEETVTVGAIMSDIFSMNNFSMYARIWDEGPVIHEEVIFELPTLRYDDLEVTDGNFDFTVRNINKEIYATYYEMIFDPAFQETAEIEKFLAEEGLSLAAQGLKNSPEVLIRDFSFTLPAGTLSSNTGVHFNGEGEIDLSDQKDLMRRITSEGEINLPHSLALDLTKSALTLQFKTLGMEMTEEEKLQVAQQMIDGYVAQGFIVADGDAYRSEFSFVYGQLILNGKEMPFPM